MSTKTCKKCGWVYPIVTPYASCRFCGAVFTEGICARCGEHSHDIIPSTRLCRACYNKRSGEYKKRVTRTTDQRQKFHRQRVKAADERFTAWVRRLKNIQTHSLTEDEWLEACRYFGGCALCGNESIDARAYFIRFEDGGKYNACNVIPVCEKCATDIKRQSNPFRQMDNYINRNLATSRGLSLANLERAAEYLQEKMRGVENAQQS